MKVSTRQVWRNTIKKYKVRPLKFFLPENLNDIKKIISEAEKEGFNVRAVGSGHSFSDVAIGNQYLVDVKKINNLLPLDTEQLNANLDASNLVQAQAGMTIQKLNKVLDKQNLCVVNMGGIDNQTIAGAISTGTHGTGKDLQAFHGMVRSIVLVAAGAKVYRIEPKLGITDPIRHNEENITLIQDDDVFNSAVVSLGCFGIIYSFILEVLPMYYLREEKKITTWNTIRDQLLDGSIFGDERGLMIQVNPYEVDGDRTCIVVRHYLLDKKPHRRINDRIRNPKTFFGNVFLAHWFSVIRAFLSPHGTPKFLNGVLKSLEDERYENKGYKVLYQGAEYVKIRAYDSEYAFDMSQNNPHWVQLVELLFEKAEQVRKINGVYQSGPTGIRFVKASTAYMCPDYGKDVMYIDSPFVRRTRGSDELLDYYQEIMIENNGIPHWGKLHDKIVGKYSLIKKHYPKIEKWKEVMLRFNPMGTFNNNFSERIFSGIDPGVK